MQLVFFCVCNANKAGDGEKHSLNKSVCEFQWKKSRQNTALYFSAASLEAFFIDGNALFIERV